MWDLWADLVLGSDCAACGAPGRALCPGCRSGLPRGGVEVRPQPCPDGLVPVRAAGEYADALRALVLAHKEHRRFALAAPLGDLVAEAVLALLRDLDCDPGQQVLLVPVPSRRAVVAARGHDPLLRIGRRAASVLRGRGRPARLLPLLRQVSRPLDQAGLTADQRRLNVAGRFGPRSRRVPPGDLVLIDDVMTTGATLREAQRALEVGGHALVGAATVTATRRTAADRPANGHPSFRSSPKGASV